MEMRMIQSYHEGCVNEALEDGVDSASLNERAAQTQAQQADNCFNPFLLFNWMRRKLVGSLSLGKMRDCSFTRMHADLPLKSSEPDCTPPQRRFDRLRRSSSHYCQVLPVDSDSEDPAEHDLIEPVYEDCVFTFRQLTLPNMSCNYESQLSDTSTNTNGTHQTSTTRTSGVYSLAEDCNDKSPVEPSSSPNAWQCSSALYATVRRHSDNCPPPLPPHRFYQQAEVQSLLSSSAATSPTSPTNVAPPDGLAELENVYESIDKLNPLPVSQSIGSLSQCRLNSRRNRLQQEIDKLHFIDSPSESLLSLDARNGRMHGVMNPMSRFNNSRRLLVDTTAAGAAQTTVFEVL